MMRWMCTDTVKDSPIGVGLRRNRIECIIELLNTSRLHWFGDVERKDLNDWVNNVEHIWSGWKVMKWIESIFIDMQKNVLRCMKWMKASEYYTRMGNETRMCNITFMDGVLREVRVIGNVGVLTVLNGSLIQSFSDDTVFITD